MAYRTFVDAEGKSWQVWEVRPSGMERRKGERRAVETAYTGAERRRGSDRRTVNKQRPFLNDFLSNGWLAFHSAAERRRLAPIPEDWEESTATELGQLCDQAVPVARDWSGHPDHALKRRA